MTSALINARRPPITQVGALGWMQKNLFNSPVNSMISVTLIAILLLIIPPLWHWFLGGAVFRPDIVACKALEGKAACWGIISEKYRLILFGRYKYDEQWRPLIATVLLLVMLFLSCRRTFWKWWILPLWGVVLAIFFTLMLGFEGSSWLPRVDSENWGGLPLTIMLSILGIGLSFPLAIVLALGRRSDLPIIKAICVIYIEFIRGIPLISVLFLASFMFPLFVPPGWSISSLIRVELGIIFFTSAYLAEVIRGGLQALPKGQFEAAQAMGLSYWQMMRLIILPQALRIVVPPMVNSFIATFKDTSLVTIVSLFELLGSLKMAFGDPVWRAFHIEGYIFISMIYFIFCFSISKYSQFLEKDLNRGVHH